MTEMTNMTEMTGKLTDLLRAAGAAHHDAFAHVNGEDPDWALWYAEFLHPQVTSQFGFAISKAEMVECLLSAATEHQARAPETDWAAFYAALLLEHLAPTPTPTSGQGQAQTLALYMTPYCPFCKMVLRAMDGLDVKIDIRDVSANPQDQADLIAARGRATVPVLRITCADGSERWMPESRDITRYLQATYG